MISGSQIREARRLLGWSEKDLARKSKLSLGTLARAEKSESEPMITIVQLGALMKTFREAGVEFIPENGDGPGVRLRKPGADE